MSLEKSQELQIQELAQGKLQSAFSKELATIVTDIQDPDKDPTETRTINIKIKVTPNDNKTNFTISAVAVSKLAQREAGFAIIKMEQKKNGQVNLFEVLEEE